MLRLGLSLEKEVKCSRSWCWQRPLSSALIPAVVTGKEPERTALLVEAEGIWRFSVAQARASQEFISEG